MGKKNFCPHCGAEIGPDWKYCSKCARPLDVTPQDYARQEAERLRLEGELRKQRIENFEKAGRYEEAAQECEHLGMFEKAGELRRKAKEITVVHIDLNSLIKQLAERGQTLTYHCCNCGAPLKIGIEQTAVLKTCPHCGYSLEVIDLAKFIRQRM